MANKPYQTKHFILKKIQAKTVQLEDHEAASKIIMRIKSGKTYFFI